MKILRASSPHFAILCILLLFPGSGLAVWKPNQKKSFKSSRHMTVRTTAYTHTESDHIVYGRKNALDTSLRLSRNYTSAASDWSRFPVGTTFRIKGSNRTYIIDDYGSALVGTDTIDIYHPTKKAMNQWGVRHVEIEILKWGDYEKSRRVLQERRGYSHVRKMLVGIDSKKRRRSPFTGRRSSTRPADLSAQPKTRPANPIDQRKAAPMPFASAKPIPKPAIAKPVPMIARPVALPSPKTPASTPLLTREKMASSQRRNFRPMTRTISVAIVEIVEPAGKASAAQIAPQKTRPAKRTARAFRPLTPGNYTGCK